MSISNIIPLLLYKFPNFIHMKISPKIMSQYFRNLPSYHFYPLFYNICFSSSNLEKNTPFNPFNLCELDESSFFNAFLQNTSFYNYRIHT